MKKRILVIITILTLVFAAVFGMTACEGKDYTVKFNAGGGTAVESVKVAIGDSVTLPEVTREGWEFDGWYLDSDYSKSLSSPYTPTSNVMLYAKWHKIVYTVSYNSNGGSNASAQIVSYGESATLPTPTRDGYTFGGWFENANLSGTAVASPYVPTKSVMLYAAWSENNPPAPVTSYTVTFNSHGGEEYTPTTVKEGGGVILPTPTRSGYIFDGWFVNEDLSGAAVTSPFAPTSDITLYAKWSENTPPAPVTYMITFNVNGGTAVAEITVNEGESITLPTPTREGYTFSGWFVNEDLSSAANSPYTPTSNVTLYAKWQKIVYAVSFNTNGGLDIPTQIVSYGDSVTLPTPTREGYTLRGWLYISSSGAGFLSSPFTPTENITLYAVWDAVPPPVITYKITLKINETTTVPLSVIEGESITLPTPKREGYTFGGWFVNENLSGASVTSPYVPTSDITLYAKWSENTPPAPVTYMITFNVNGGTALDEIEVTEGESIAALPTPKREGYTFGGWFVNENLSGTAVTSPYAPTSDITLYAKWSENTPPAPVTYTVTFNVNGGTALDEIEVTEGESITLPTPTREGYTFGGWFENANLSGAAVTSPYVPTSDITLYAKWSENNPPAPVTYMITFNVNGGTAVAEITVNEGESITLPTPKREGYTFGGWFVNENLSGTAVTSPYAPTSDITLHAAWNDNYSYLTFTLDGEGYVVAANASDKRKMPSVLIIPSTYNGKSVVAIADNAFSRCTVVQTVTIPNTVTTIGENAFSGCNALTEVSIPQSVTSIKIGAFSDCTVLKRVNIADMEAWLRIDLGDRLANPLNNGSDLYLGNALVYGIAVPESITRIKPYAFYGCTSLKSIAITNGEAEIGASAFSDCSELRVFNAPQSVKFVGQNAFLRCTALTRVYVSDLHAWLNTNFADINANPLYYAGELYVKHALVTNFVLPSEFTIVKPYVFCGSTSLTSIVLHEGVTEIGASAFYDCAALSDAVIPSGITKIGVNAFSGCKALTKFNITDFDAWLNIDFGNAAANPMYNAVTLTIGGDPASDIVIPEGKTVKPYALSSLVPFTVTLQGGVTEILDYAFSGCRAMTGITLPTSIGRAGCYAFADCEALPQIQLPNITSIGEGAFSGCHSLSEFIIPSGVTEILASTFYNCRAINSIVIPDTVVSIGDNAFANCFKLSGVTFGSGLTQIGVRAFVNCTALTEIVIPKNVSTVGYGAFSGCTSVTAITLNEGLVAIGSLAFARSGITSLVIPNSVSTLENAAFAACRELESVVIGDGLTKIGSQAFVSCFKLMSVTFGASVEVIGARAFMNCDSLTSVVIPSTVKAIERNAFTECSNLARVVIPSSVEVMGDAVFLRSNNLTDIWCEATETPIGWDENWAASSSQAATSVHFGDTWHYVDGVPTLKTAE